MTNERVPPRFTGTDRRGADAYGRGVESSRLVVSGTCVVAIFSWLVTAVAQEPSALHLTLADAHARAQAASHRLAELDAREAGARAAIEIRRASSQPSLSVQAAYTRINHIEEFILPSGPGGAARVLYPDVPDTYRTRLDFQWPIYSGGRSDALVRAARAEASASTADREAARADLRLEVARSYWALVTARATVGVLEQALERARAHVRDARERLDAGLTPPNELASTQALESRQRMLLIEARNQRDIAAADLARLIGAPLEQPIEPVEPLDTDMTSRTPVTSPAPPALLAPPAPLAPPALLAPPTPMRPERQALELRIQAAEHRREAAARAMRPSLFVGGGFDYARPNPRIFPLAERWDDSWDAGIRVNWPLWDGGRASAEAAEASASTMAAQRRLAEFDSSVALEVRRRQLELASALAAVEAATDGVTSATEARRVVAERYAAGVATNTEVLDGQTALLQAELDRTLAFANVRLAEARRARALGR